MNTDQEQLKSLGFFGIFKESFRIIFSSSKKIFTQIILFIILPLSFIYLFHLQISHSLFYKIIDSRDALNHSHAKTLTILFWVFNALFFIFLVILSLVATSAVVYTIACIYTQKHITFKSVLKVIPKVWKRILITSVWYFFLLLVYNIIAGGLIFLWALIFGASTVGIVIIVVFAILYFVGFVYICITWHLSSVISVLEDDYGIKAMKKSMGLIKGKTGVAVAFFLVFSVCFVGTGFGFHVLVLFGLIENIGLRILMGIFCLLLLVFVISMSLVVVAVIYFVCKSYHHETVDKSLLERRLEVYVGEYVTLRKDVQLVESQV